MSDDCQDDFVSVGELRPLKHELELADKRFVLAARRAWKQIVVGRHVTDVTSARAMMPTGTRAVRAERDHTEQVGISMGTLDPYAALQDARKLEELKFIEWLNESATKTDSEISAARQRMAARGVFGSPMAFTAEVHILLGRIEIGIDNAIEFRRELAAKASLLLTPDELRKLEDKLTQFVDAGMNGIKQRSTMQPRGSGGASLAQELEVKAMGFKAGLKRKRAALPLEARLGMHETV